MTKEEEKIIEKISDLYSIDYDEAFDMMYMSVSHGRLTFNSLSKILNVCHKLDSNLQFFKDICEFSERMSLHGLNSSQIIISVKEYLK